MELHFLLKNIVNVRMTCYLGEKGQGRGNMPHIFSYRDSELYSHHTIDIAPEPENFSMHAHEMMEIYYFKSGRGSYLVEGSSYALEPGDIMIMRAAEAHRLTISPDEPYERIAIHFAQELMAGFDPELRLLRPFMDRPLGQQNHYSARDKRCAHLQTVFMDFDFEGIGEVRLNLIARLLLFLTALNGIFESTEDYQNSAADLPGQIVRYVNRHLFEPISLQSVADSFYRSRSQISRIFRQATGSSFWDYISIKRMLAARAMIQRGEKASTAALTCGFTDYSAFYRAYRNYFGHSPKSDSQ